jgi:hypothetical protein
MVIGQPAVIAKARARGIRVGKRQPATRAGPGRDRVRWAMTTTATGAAVGAWPGFGSVAQRRQDQSRRHHQPQEVHSGDHQHQLSVA